MDICATPDRADALGYSQRVTPDAPTGTWIESDVPSRLDALGWSVWHRRVILALGITWILDGLEASLISNLASTIEKTSGWTATQVGASNTAYLIGEVAGALVFGRLTDQLGRKKLFLVTLALYLVSTALSGLAPWYALFVPLRFFAGLSAREAALAMGRQEGTVRGLQFRAIAALRRELGIAPDIDELGRVSGTTR